MPESLFQPVKGLFHLYVKTPRNDNHAGTTFTFQRAVTCAMSLAQNEGEAIWILEEVNVWLEKDRLTKGYRYYFVEKPGKLPELVQKDGREMVLDGSNGRMALIDFGD